MKHAGPAALDTLEDLLLKLRKHAALREKSRGCFYRKGSSFLHFHEDPEGMFADLKQKNGDFARFRVSSARERAAFMREVAQALAD